MPIGSASGPIRGMATIEPLFLKPPCGIHVEKRAAARSARQLLGEGWSLQELRDEWHFRTAELATTGVTARELADAGVPTREIAACAQYSADEKREAGASALEMMGAGYSAASLVRAGYTPRAFRFAGMSAGAIRSLGFSEEEMLRDGVVGSSDESAYMHPPPRRPTSAASSRSRMRRSGSQAQRPHTALAAHRVAPAAASAPELALTQ